MFRFALSILVLAFACVAVTSANEPSADARAAMVNLNSEFISAHAAARKMDLAGGAPIVLLRSGRLVLMHKGRETSVEVFPPEYDTFKTFAHLGAAVYLLLATPDYGELCGGRLGQLRDYREKLQRVGENIDNIGMAGAELERQKILLATSSALVDKVLAAKRVSRDELIAYTRSLAPLIRENLAGAAKAQIDGMHRQMMIWKKGLTPDEWKQLRVAIRGAVLARRDNLAKQYFQALLGLRGEGERLVYMELYFPPTPMETLLATRAVDRGLAIAIFDDPDRMYRDVLADAATEYLKTMKFE
jgi:hypothetical protein